MSVVRELAPGDLVRLTVCGRTIMDHVEGVKRRPGVFETISVYVFANSDLPWLSARVLERMVERGEAAVVRLKEGAPDG